MVLLPHKGTPADIAKVVRFLTSADEDFMTGVIVRINGGIAIDF